MAITTLAGVQAGMRPPQYYFKASPGGTSFHLRTMFGPAGNPKAGVYDATLNGAVCNNTTVGAISFINPASGNSYLARMEIMSSAVNGSFILMDRLWHNGGFTITSTGAQSITSPTWPARDLNGSTNGEGVFLFLELSVGAGSAAPNITVSYTNSAGTSGRTGVNVEPVTTGTRGISSCWAIGLQAGDTGVRSVQSLTLDASWVSGTMNLVAARPIAYVDGYATPSTGPRVWDCTARGLARIYDSSCLYFLHNSNTTSGVDLEALISFTQG